MVAKETKFSKETKVAKEVIVISSSDDEVSSDDAIMNDEDIPEYYFAMPKASNSKVYTSSDSKASALKASKVSKTLKVLTSSASKSKASNFKFMGLLCFESDDNDVMDMNDKIDNLEDMISNLEKSDRSSDEVPSSDDTSSDGPSSDETYYDDTTKKPKTTARKGPTKELLKWYDDTTDDNITKFEVAAKSKDSRLESRKLTMDISFTLGFVEKVDNLRILQSCNGLLFCSGLASPAFDYIYNPCTNLFKRLPQLENSHDDLRFYVTIVLRMAFDLRKSLDYKVVQVVGRINYDLKIQVHSLKTGKWSLCRDQFIYYNFSHFASAIYWNDAFYWLETKNRQLTLYKLNIKDPDHPIITTIQWVASGKELLLVFWRDDIGSREFTIYEVIKGCSMWMVRYLVNIDEFMTPLPERWLIQSTVWSIGLGEREEDFFKVLKYNLTSKTINEIFDIGSNQMDDDDDDDDDDGFIPPFSVDPSVYELIPSFTSV
ncbi:hypothetical protein Tco_0003499 [Tanacetum coccineum]